MASEVRTFEDAVIDVHKKLRDIYLTVFGTTVTFQVPPGGETIQDMYGDIDITSFVNLKTQVIIKWGNYRALLSSVNSSEEHNVPLELIVKLSDNIPKGSRVTLKYTNASGVEVTRVFEVIGPGVKIEKHEHAKSIMLAPLRI